MNLIEMEHRLKNIYNNNIIDKKLVEIGTLLTNIQERYAVIKGVPLSKMAYNDPYFRTSLDFDLLICRKNIKTIESVLIKNNYIQPNASLDEKTYRERKILLLSASHQLLSYAKVFDDFSIVIDLNFDIFWGEYEGKRINIDEFLSDIIEMEICGVKVKTLPPLKAMIQLVLHHYKDMNSIFLLATRNSIRYEMFKDVYYLLKNNLEVISIERLYAISKEYEIIPYIFYVLYYTGQVFDDEIIQKYIKAFSTPEGEALLNCYGLCSKERKEWRCDFKTRFEADNIFDLIKDDLTEKDNEKIAINKRVFGGE